MFRNLSLFSFLAAKDGGERILCRLVSVTGHSDPVTVKPIVKDKVPVQPMTVYGEWRYSCIHSYGKWYNLRPGRFMSGKIACGTY